MFFTRGSKLRLNDLEKWSGSGINQDGNKSILQIMDGGYGGLMAD
jgi:hypothetical protein